MNRFEGKVALITGASSGIGAGIATEFVKLGLWVVGLGRRVDKIEELAKELANEPGRLYAVKCDVTNEEEILKTFKWITEDIGPLHILVNNAGVARECLLTGNVSDKYLAMMLKYQQLFCGCRHHDGRTNLPNYNYDASTEDFRTTFETNVIALCVCTREAYKIMKSHDIDGHIIHINSISGHGIPATAVPNLNVYPASKHAVTALTEILRKELAYFKAKIKVTSISPGLVTSEVFDKWGVGMTSALSAMPHLTPKDVADCIVFVLSTPVHVQVHEMIVRPVGETL